MRFVCFIFGLILTFSVSAQSLVRDPNFGNDGQLFPENISYNDLTYITSLLLPSEDMLVLAYLVESGTGNTYIFKYNSEGDLQTDFGTQGFVKLPDSFYPTKYSVKLDTTGQNPSILLAATKQSPTSFSDLWILRYNTDGTSDETFGSDGQVITDFNSHINITRALEIDRTSGDFYIGGENSENYSQNAKYLLVRYNRNGSLDSSFGTNGKVITDSGVNAYKILTDIMIQPHDGKIIAYGDTYTGEDSRRDLTVVRYLSNGTLDTGFNNTGIKIQPMYIDSETPIEAFIDSTDNEYKLLIAGNLLGSSNIFLFRMNENGENDPSFGTNGVKTVNFDSKSYLNYFSDAVVSGTNLLLTGSLVNNLNYHPHLASINLSTGTLNSDWGSNGILHLPDIQNVNSYGQTIHLLSNGKILISGLSTNGYMPELNLTSVSSDGTLLNTRQLVTLQNLPVSPISDSYVSSSHLQSDGKLILAVGFLDDLHGTSVMRLNEDGTPDLTFNSTGRRNFFFSDYVSSVWRNALTIQSDNKILLLTHSGFAGQSSGSQNLIRILENGDVDNSFADNGIFTFPALPGFQSYSFSNIVTTPDNMLICFGIAYSGESGSSAIVIRLTEDGVFDESFNGSGYKIFNWGLGINFESVKGLLFPNGQMLMALTQKVTTTTEKLRILKITSDGLLESSFRGSGSFLDNTTHSSDVLDLTAAENGSFYVLSSGTGPGQNKFIKKFDSNGFADTSFSADGILDLIDNPDIRVLETIQNTPEGIFAGGAFWGNETGYSAAMLMKLTPSGNIDSAFGMSGNIQFPYYPTEAYYDDGSLVNIHYDEVSDVIWGTGYAAPSEEGRYYSLIAKLVNSQTLPVELVSFSSKISDNNILLNWSTLTESNNSGWEIERRSHAVSASGQHWEKIGFVAGKGTTTESQNYSFAVSRPELKVQSYQFRLKQIDTDGNFSYSNILSVNTVPVKFELDQNYPNPFNPATSFRFSLPFSGNVSLKVYDMTGREIAILLNGEMNGGYHETITDFSQFSSGVYYYVLEFNGQRKINKMTLMK